MQQRAKNRNIRKASSASTMTILWTLMAGIMLLQLMPFAQAAYRDDPCETKGMAGVCKSWNDCPIIKTLIDTREYSNREVVSCGFEARGELICCPIRTETKISDTTVCETKSQSGVCKKWGECPVIKSLIESAAYTTAEVVRCGFDAREELICCPLAAIGTKIETDADMDMDRESTTTSSAQERDFWLDVLDSLNSTTTTTTTSTTTTTQKPDFWLDLLTTTSTTTTKPLIIGDERLDESSEFFDFSKLLNKNKGKSNDNAANSGNGRATGVPLQPNANNGPEVVNPWNINHNNQPNLNPQNNDRGNFNGGRGQQNVGIGNGFSNNPPQINGFRPNNNQQNIGRGNVGRGQNNNFNQQNNGRGNVGLGQNNNWTGRSGNQNQPFTFPANTNNRPGNLNGFPNNGPGQQRPANNGLPQNSGIPAPTPDDGDAARVNQLIRNVFQTSAQTNRSEVNPTPNIDEFLESVFNESPAPSSTDLEAQGSNPIVLWVNPSDQVEVMHPNQFGDATPIQYTEFMPVIESYMAGNDLETAPSTHEYVQQVTFNPIQQVYHNLLGSGMDIVKAKAEMIQPQQASPHQGTNQFGQQPGQSQFGRQPLQQQQQQFSRQPQIGQHLQFGQQSQIGQQPQFGQQPVQFGQQPEQQQQSQFGRRPFPQQQQQSQFGRQPFPQQQQQQQQPPQQQPFGQLPQIGRRPSQEQQQSTFERQNSQHQQQHVRGPSDPKQPRSPIQFVEEPPNGFQMPNVQSPPTQILDPFKPFEFRPPPADEIPFEEDDNSISRPTANPVPVDANDRPAVRACRRIQNGLKAGLSNHILGGIPSDWGEFPHMAAIGYGRLGDDNQGPFDIRCGGTLIDSRFVLTAAHCVASRDSIPAIVRLGVVDFKNPDQMREAVEIRIKETHIHDDYSQRRTYNDIAILELEEPVTYNEYIYPVCLYTDLADPSPDIKLWVTGWGTINTTTRTYSELLLKAPLHVTPLVRCNASFVDYGLTRQIEKGIIDSQLCAEDAERFKDACQGDSGGPLNLIVDESKKSYRVVGVVSSGFGCASSTPGLYTRVAAFLDFVEKIVWPNGGD